MNKKIEKTASALVSAGSLDLLAKGVDATPSLCVSSESFDTPENFMNESTEGIIDAEFYEVTEDDCLGKNEFKDMLGMALNDVGNGERFLHLFGDEVLFNSESKRWYIWTGKKWNADFNNKIYRMAVQTYKKCQIAVEEVKWTDETARTTMQRHAKNMGNGSTLRAMLNQAAIQRSASSNDFDSNNDLLSCQNGTINLKTGELSPHSRKDYISKISPCEFISESKPEAFLHFLNKIFNDDIEMINYMQKVLGYFLTGWTKEQCFFIAYGAGANGKSTLTDLVSKIIPEQTVTISAGALMDSKKNGTASPELANTKGARLVLAAESNDTDNFDEAKIKQMTGGDKIYARLLYSQGFEFTPTFKIWLSTNHKPRINGSDNGIWRRIHLVPFSVIIPEQEQDRELAQKLEAEKNAIFSWMVEGARKLLAEGLQKPAAVEEALREYRSNMDALHDFLTDWTECDAKSRVQSSVLYESYVEYCKLNVNECLTNKDFSKKVVDKGFKKIKASNYFFTGLKMKRFVDENGKTSLINSKIA